MNALDALAEVFLERWQIEGIVFRDEGDTDPFCAGPAGTTYAMHVVFRVFGQVIVEDVGDAIDMDTASPRRPLPRDRECCRP